LIVAAGAADTARKVLKRGGNAVDTVVAVAFTLAVTHADAGNLGGGGFATLWMDGKPYFIDYRETAPRAASATMYLDASGNVIPDSSTVGARAARVPGTVRGLWELHQRFGKLPWKVDLEPAIDNAEHGFLPDKGMADLRDDRQKQLGARTNFRRYFSAMRAGKTFRQPELAATLRRIAASGPGDFSVLGETALSESGTVTLNDLAHVVPGLTSIDQGPGDSRPQQQFCHARSAHRRGERRRQERFDCRPDRQLGLYLLW
jgi:gamma-glutamyltranspeptidase/glutathione hydrolase